MITIALVDDENSIRTSVSLALESEGFNVDVFPNGIEALEALESKSYDLGLFDIKMPKMDGNELLAKVRSSKKDNLKEMPIIFLTSKDQEQDEIIGLRMGAADYITKPFSVNELMARVKAVLRRIRPMFTEEVLSYKGIVVDLVSHSVNRDNETLHLGPTEFNLLVFFMENIGRVFSREQLLNHVWKDEAFVEPRTVDVHIRRLRKAINNDVKEDYIRTVRSAGYSFGS